MLKHSIIFSFALIISQIACAARQPYASHSPAGFAVLELFTSEGCSSCPSAEKALEDLEAQYPQQLFILEFHVDYWNNLGWKDLFSSKAYTERQQEYVRHFSLSSAYTPQVVANGKTEFVGSDKLRLKQATEEGLRQVPKSGIDATANRVGNILNAMYSISGQSNVAVNFALVQRTALSDVKRGENAGRKLRHSNVVRDFKAVTYTGGRANVALEIPDGLRNEDISLVVFVQDAKSHTVTSATRIFVP